MLARYLSARVLLSCKGKAALPPLCVSSNTLKKWTRLFACVVVMAGGVGRVGAEVIRRGGIDISHSQLDPLCARIDSLCTADNFSRHMPKGGVEFAMSC